MTVFLIILGAVIASVAIVAGIARFALKHSAYDADANRTPWFDSGYSMPTSGAFDSRCDDGGGD